ncbi:MAG: ABC transporter permease [Lachnospiraceae bacterium]|nr:ABC transporter permease [Lachnospiraceae bacterium]
MKYLSIFKGRTRALFTDVNSLLILIIIVIVSVFISKAGQADLAAKTRVAVVNEDNGEYAKELVELLLHEEAYDFYETTYEEAMKSIAKSKVHGVVEIGSGFSDRIGRGEYVKLVKVTVMSDSGDMNSFTEYVINDSIKIWMEALTERKLVEIVSPDEEERIRFRKESAEILAGESLLDIEAVPIYLQTDTREREEENTYSGLRWYAALSLFYLIISGTWMCDYGSGNLLSRAFGKNLNIALLFFVQALPGLCITTIGLIPVLIAEKPSANPAFVIISYILYAVGASGMALIVCTVAGKLSNLVLVAPVITMAASLISGLLCKLPDWAGFWEIVSVVIPGHWFREATLGRAFLLGGLITGVSWLLAGMLLSALLGRFRKRFKGN